jgi:hypothetical protein
MFMTTRIRNLSMLSLAVVLAMTVQASSAPRSSSASKKAATTSSTMLVSSLVAPNLGAARGYAVLAASTVTNTGASAIVGDLGLSPGISVTGFPPGMLAGTLHIADPSGAQAQLDLTAAVQRCRRPHARSGHARREPGRHDAGPGPLQVDLSLEISSGDLTLDAQGDASAVYVFQMAPHSSPPPVAR